MNIYKAILVIGVILAMGIFLGSCHLLAKEKTTKATKVYISERFNQDIEFIRTVTPAKIADGTRYRSYFSPLDNPELIFFVHVKPSTYEIIGDSYYSAYFELRMRGYFENSILSIWKENATLDVLVYRDREKLLTPPGFDRKNPIEEPLEEMALVFYSESLNRYSFNFIIDVSLSLENTSIIMEEARRVYGYIRILQDSSFKPNALILRYNKSRPTIFDRFFDDTHIQLTFNDWVDIKTIEQVREHMIVSIK
jgi:hypothetical protein